MRTRVTNDSTRILWVTFAPPGARVPNEEFAGTAARFNGGVVRVSSDH